MYIAILGRLPALGIAELEKKYHDADVGWFSDQSALINTSQKLTVEQLGGSQKIGRVIFETRGDWRAVSTKIVAHYAHSFAGYDGKVTLGLSAYGFKESARDIQKTGLLLKQQLKKANVSLRLIPNNTPALNTATSHHNKLGLADNKIELLVVRAKNGAIIVAESTGAQNITAYTKRDQGRPKRDAFVGMLPPKLAQIIINLATPTHNTGRVLDPFCGTGVVLQEALLMGYDVYGTDLSDKMVDFSTQNIEWLTKNWTKTPSVTIYQGDAMDSQWQQPVDAVACEGYLGQPFSAPPSPAKLIQVQGNCDHILKRFLTNIGPQLKPGTPLCIGVPAWRSANGNFTHLPLIKKLDTLGYDVCRFKTINPSDLLYFREDQIVARELLVLVKK